ncbi:restriction endonuclease subunit S [Aeromonas dhakensis]|uniref:restriction endonuclease subunit S n=1 Tax=Aeromonas dhakensis TaxID=196024 RepID=UPI002B47912B|nr:restriction endonuclease subunit S [Aeromonas dhakensis]
MSSEWVKLQIKDLGRIVTGKTPSTSRADYFGGPIPFLTPTDMVDGKKSVSVSRSLTLAGLASVKNNLVPKGVAVSCIGWQMGKSVLISQPTVTNQQINTVVVDESKFDLHFVYYLLSSMRERIFELGATATRTPIVNKSTFGQIVVSVPQLHEQKLISEFLSAIDSRIAILRDTNATLEAIAQTLFKSWFVDFEPVHARARSEQPAGLSPEVADLFPDSFEESALGMIPKGWQAEPLDEIADFLNGLALQKYPPDGDETLPVIKIAQLRKGDTVGADRASRNIKPEYIIQNGDVLFSWSGSLEVEVWCGGEGALNQHLFKVTSQRFKKWFYLRWTKTHLTNFKHIAASKATTMGHIQRKHLTEAMVVVPSSQVLAEADKIFGPLLDQWVNNAEQAQTLATLRDTLLSRLISGQLRLPEGDAMLQDAGI